MITEWQLQDAKNKFSEVVENAINSGPQEITKRGVKAAVVLSIQDYEKLKKKKGSLANFFKQSPLAEINLGRKRDFSREVEF